jgi:hypothetical protein
VKLGILLLITVNSQYVGISFLFDIMDAVYGSQDTNKPYANMAQNTMIPFTMNMSGRFDMRKKRDFVF